MATSILNTQECSICCEGFKIPKILQCGHTFCLECINRYIGDKTDKFLCPICGQDVKIPEGGTRMFITNFIAQTSPQGDKLTPTPPSTTNTISTGTPQETNVIVQSVSSTQNQCPYHQRPVDYYCVTCHSLICHKCFVKCHQGHEYLDVECDTAKEKAKEFLSSSEKFIQNKIKELEETHTQLVETSEKLLRLTEDACSRITKQTETIIADIKTSSETAKLDIRNMFVESEAKLNGARENVMEHLKNFKLDLQTHLPSTSEDSCIQILTSLPKIKELEKLCEGMKDDTPVLYKYGDWNEKDFSVKLDMFGSVVTKQYFAYKPNCFRFNINKLSLNTRHYSEDKWCSNGIIWSCSALKYRMNDTLYLTINIELLDADNPGLDYCVIDGQLKLLNIDDDRQTLTTSCSNQMVTSQPLVWAWKKFIRCSKLKDKNYGYLTSDNQFVIQLNITQIREIIFK